MRSIYLDHAAATPVAPEVFKVMRPYFSQSFGNPSSIYNLGMEANAVLNDSRRSVAQILHALPDNIIFTGGGTESNNLAIFGIAKAFVAKNKGVLGHIITTPIEHDSVLAPMRQLAKEGWKITYLKVDSNGFVDPDEVIATIRPSTVLISVMYANNEIGTVEPIAEIGKRLLRYRKEKNSLYPYFHTDACQTPEYLDLDVEKLHVDLMSLNGGKIYGPKGSGMLYIRRGISLQPLRYGGGQERGLRAGTENIPAIVGFTKALELAQKHKDKETKRLTKLCDYFLSKLQKKVPGVFLNGPKIGTNRLPNNLNITFPRLDGEAALIYLNEQGVYCSTGSACSLNSAGASHVLEVIGLSEVQARSTLRFTLGRKTNKEAIDFAIKAIEKIKVLLFSS